MSPFCPERLVFDVSRGSMERTGGKERISATIASCQLTCVRPVGVTIRQTARNDPERLWVNLMRVVIIMPHDS